MSTPSTTNKITAANGLDTKTFLERYLDAADLKFKSNKDGQTYRIDMVYSADLTCEQTEWCFNLIHSTSYDAYRTSENGWRPDHKKKEMADPNLRYLLVRRENDSESLKTQSHEGLVGFSSCMLTIEDDYETIYVYELHLEESARRTGLGRQLVSVAESIGRRAGMEKCMLTVFSCNESGEAFYRNMGYTEARDSPRNKVSRSGLVRKPEYYIMEKDL